MTVLYLTEYNTRCYGVSFQTIGCFNVQKFEDISDDKDNILHIKPLELRLGKSKVCDMTLMSGALDKPVFDGHSILLEISEENDEHRYAYVGGNTICSFLNIAKFF